MKTVDFRRQVLFRLLTFTIGLKCFIVSAHTLYKPIYAEVYSYSQCRPIIFTWMVYVLRLASAFRRALRRAFLCKQKSFVLHFSGDFEATRITPLLRSQILLTSYLLTLSIGLNHLRSFKKRYFTVSVI